MGGNKLQQIWVGSASGRKLTHLLILLKQNLHLCRWLLRFSRALLQFLFLFSPMHFHILFSSLCNWFLICSLCFLHSLWNLTSVLTLLLYDPASSGTHQHSPPRSKSLEGETASRLFQTRRLQPRLNKPQGRALPSSIAAFRGQTAQTVLQGKQAGRRRGRGTDWGHRWGLADSCCQACGWTKHQFPWTKALAPPTVASASTVTINCKGKTRWGWHIDCCLL